MLLNVNKCDSKYCNKFYTSETCIKYKGMNLCCNVCRHIIGIQQYIMAKAGQLKTDDLLEEIQTHMNAYQSEMEKTIVYTYTGSQHQKSDS